MILISPRGCTVRRVVSQIGCRAGLLKALAYGFSHKNTEGGIGVLTPSQGSPLGEPQNPQNGGFALLRAKMAKNGHFGGFLGVPPKTPIFGVWTLKNARKLGQARVLLSSFGPFLTKICL